MSHAKSHAKSHTTAITDTPQQTFDDLKAEACSARLAQMLDDGAIAVMLSVGHRSGLLSAMANLPPATSEAIAAAAQLHERYVREWLAVMVTGGLVEFDAADRSYRLPLEHAACLTDGGAFGNFAVYAQCVALAGAMQERLLGAFRTGEGIDYAEFPCFHQFMCEDSAQTVAANIEEIVETLAPALPGRLASGIDVLDSGCGAGRALIRLAELYPASRFTGVDFSSEAIDMARAEANRRGLQNVRFEIADMMQFGEESSYDLLTSFDAVHDVKHPQDLLCRLARALRRDGLYLMQDIGGSAQLENNLDFPFAPFLYTISCAHCTPVSLAQGGDGLGAMWGWETAEAMLGTAGFADISRTVLPHDPMNVWFVSRKS